MSAKKGARFAGVVAKFSTQLTELSKHLKGSQMHFVRCFKPNARLKPKEFDADRVSAQLRCNSVVQACLLMKAGFPDRLPFTLALSTYSCVKVRHLRTSPQIAQDLPFPRPSLTFALSAYSCVKVAVPPKQRLAPAAVPPIADLTPEVEQLRASCALLMADNGIDPTRWCCGRTALCLKVSGGPSACFTTHTCSVPPPSPPLSLLTVKPLVQPRLTLTLRDDLRVTFLLPPPLSPLSRPPPHPRQVGVLPELDHLRNLALFRAATKLETAARGMLRRREYADRLAAHHAALAEAAAKAAAKAAAEAAAAAAAAAEAEAAAAAEASPGGLLSARKKKKPASRGTPVQTPLPSLRGAGGGGGALSSARALLSFRGAKNTPTTANGTPSARTGGPSTPAPEVADPHTLQTGERVWHVSNSGHVRHVTVVGVAEGAGSREQGAGASHTPGGSGSWAAAPPGASSRMHGVMSEPRYSVQYVQGAAAPFVAHAARLLRTPPSATQLATLQLQSTPSLPESAAAVGERTAAEAEKAERIARSRARRLDKLRQLHEQTAKNWSLWHPQCRPPSAPVMAIAPAGFEDVPQALLEYAHYLGMSFPEDASYLWIAEQGLAAELPDSWCMRRDPELLVYFFDPTTSSASRQHPSDEHFRGMYYTHKFARVDDGGGGGGASASGTSYLSTLIGRVESRHVIDALKNVRSRASARPPTHPTAACACACGLCMCTCACVCVRVRVVVVVHVRVCSPAAIFGSPLVAGAAPRARPGRGGLCQV